MKRTTNVDSSEIIKPYNDAVLCILHRCKINHHIQIGVEDFPPHDTCCRRWIQFFMQGITLFLEYLGAVAEQEHEGCVTTFGYGIRLQQKCI